MKTFKMKLIANNLALMAVLAVLAGCVSHSYDKGAATAAALQSSADAVAETSARVNDALAALNNLTFKSEGDLRNQFDAFGSAIGNLDKSNDKLALKVAETQAKASVYFDNWSNQLSAIQSEELRTRSTARRDEVTAKLADVNASYQNVKNSFKPFVSDLKDIQTYLGTDLTAGGLAAVKDIVAKTKVDAVPLRDSIKKLQASFSDLSTALSPMMPRPDK
jgi:Protein of unknown function (DUF2959)